MTTQQKALWVYGCIVGLLAIATSIGSTCNGLCQPADRSGDEQTGAKEADGSPSTASDLGVIDDRT